MLARLVARARPGPEPDYWWRQRYWCTLQEASLGAAVVAAAAGIEARFMAAGEARAPAAAAAPPSPRPEPDTRERLVAALRGGLWRAVEACARTGVPPEAELFASLEALCAEVGLTVEEAVQLVDAEAAEGNNPIGQALQPGQRISMERLESPPLVPKTPAGLLSFICFHMILWSCECWQRRQGWAACAVPAGLSRTRSAAQRWPASKVHGANPCSAFCPAPSQGGQRAARCRQPGERGRRRLAAHAGHHPLAPHQRRRGGGAPAAAAPALHGGAAPAADLRGAWRATTVPLALPSVAAICLVKRPQKIMKTGYAFSHGRL